MPNKRRRFNGIDDRWREKQNEGELKQNRLFLKRIRFKIKQKFTMIAKVFLRTILKRYKNYLQIFFKYNLFFNHFS